MTRRFSCLWRSAALAAMMSLPAAAQEYSNGGQVAAGRKAATLTPVEAFGVHPPGIDPADAQRRCASMRQIYFPYYAPLSPVASTARWKPWSYRPLAPYYTPYYCGYSPHRLFNPPPRPYGSNGWGKGPLPEQPLPSEETETPLDYGGYTSVVADDTVYWNMGGNGLVPYGAEAPAGARAADLVDEIQASRPRRRFRGLFRAIAPAEPPVIIDSPEAAGDQKKGDEPAPERSSRRRPQLAEPIPPGEASDRSQ